MATKKRSMIASSMRVGVASRRARKGKRWRPFCRMMEVQAAGLPHKRAAAASPEIVADSNRYDFASAASISRSSSMIASARAISARLRRAITSLATASCSSLSLRFAISSIPRGVGTTESVSPISVPSCASSSLGRTIPAELPIFGDLERLVHTGVNDEQWRWQRGRA